MPAEELVDYSFGERSPSFAKAFILDFEITFVSRGKREADCVRRSPPGADEGHLRSCGATVAKSGGCGTRTHKSLNGIHAFQACALPFGATLRKISFSIKNFFHLSK